METGAATTDPHSPAQLVDLDCYPILDLTAPATRRLARECREQLDRTGACELPGFLTSRLAAGVWSGDLSRAHRVANRLDAGMVFVNRYGCYDFASPFGGFKHSGWGKEMAMHSLHAYTKLKSIWVKV